jgi:pimeloyl-ACP methyl ester carboxylesterase
MISSIASISIGSKVLHYHKYGAGPKVILAFHGFGNQALMYEPMGEALPDEYTLYAFDFPFHGNSQGFEGVLDNQDLLYIVRYLAQIHQQSKVTLMGYSIGGKAVLSILTHEPTLVAQFYLMAADGLVPNRVYNLLMYSAWGRYLFNRNISNPNFLLATLGGLRRLRLVPEDTHKLLLHFLNNEQERLQLLQGWPALRGITVSQQAAKQAILQHSLAGHIYMGKYDKVIPMKNAITFAQHLPSVVVHILEKGHKLMRPTLAKEIVSRLL